MKTKGTPSNNRFLSEWKMERLNMYEYGVEGFIDEVHSSTFEDFLELAESKLYTQFREI